MNTNQHDLSDDELDNLFRNSAEKIGFDFDADSWKKMSQKLDAVNIAVSGENQTKDVWLKRGLPILLALLFVVGGYYALKPSSKQENITLQTNQKNSSANKSKVNTEKHVATDDDNTTNFQNEKTENTKSKIVLENKVNSSKPVSYENKKLDEKNSSVTKTEEKSKVLGNEKLENPATKSKSVVSKNENSAKIAANQSFDENKRTSKNKTIFTEKSNNNSTNTVISDSGKDIVLNENNKDIFSEKIQSEAKFQKSKTSLEVTNTQVSENESNNISSQIPNNQIVSSESNSIVKETEEKNRRWQLGEIKNINHKNSSFKANFQLPIVAFSQPRTEPVIPISPKTSFQKGLYFRAAISPDFSVVMSNSFEKMGNNGALLLEYRFNKHWSLQGGVIRSLKRYIATPEQYNWNTNWNNPTPMIFVDATCKMLDIPLNIRYDITQKANSRLFVSSGFTSYIMLKEDYYYNYKDNTNPNIKYREWSTKTGNYPFSVMNFSLGYERQILRKLSFQAEPFIKIPLGEVGYGKVKLATIGVFFSAKYPIAKF